MRINSDSGEIRRTMEQLGLSFKKQFGQNFLSDRNYVDRIVALSVETSGVLEIGPGIGTMTSALLEKHEKVLCVEIDKDLSAYLSSVFSGEGGFNIITDDFMNLDIPKTLNEYFGGERISVTANLPYYITTPIITELVKYPRNIGRITIMIQKEVASRLTAQPGSADYGSITAFVSYFGKVTKAFNVPHGAFTPPPKVDSSVLTIDLYKEKPYTVKDENLLFKFIRGGFAKRRKTLINSLTFEFGDDKKEKLLSALAGAGIDPKKRGETLSIEDYIRLSDCYLETGNNI